MVFLDTSAVVAVLAGEPDAASFAVKLEAEPQRISAGHVLLEASTRLASLLGLTPTVADGLITRLFREADVGIVPITAEVAQIAVAAFERYGKGRGAVANLNLGDCLSYACAKAHDARLLGKGHDFSQTDIARA